LPNELGDKIRKAAILNAIKHDGKADTGAVLGNLLGENADLRAKARELTAQVRQVIEEINSTPLEKLRAIAAEHWPEALTKERREEQKKLPPLPNASNYQLIVTRLAPNPDFVLHIGNARAAILSHDYAKMYDGKFIVRFEDTDPRLKKSQLRYYDIIREDLKWLGCNWDAEYIQSDRLPIYYGIGETLLTQGAGYICECTPERFRELVNKNTACPDRDLDAETHSDRWRKMLDGGYKEGEAVFRVKTELAHPNPAVRDWPAFRIIDTVKNPHPRVGSKFRVWPLYNMASGVDDHELGITHVIRGKEHLTNMARQIYMYQYLGWKYPDAVHYGRLKVEGMELSKSKLMKGLESGEYKDVDDPRLGTLAALRRRGYNPETIRQLIWDVGPKPVDVTISWDNINSLNRKIIDPTSHRYFFVADPVATRITGINKSYDIRAPLHPQHPEMGTRTLKLQPQNQEASVFLAGADRAVLEAGKVVRLMGLFNLRPLGISDGELRAQFHGEEVDELGKVPILQWVPAAQNLRVEVVMPNATIKNGLAEVDLGSEPVGAVVQFVRFGFGRVDDVTDNRICMYFAHE
jgi:glutamyl-tRNA synthetase